MYLFDLGLIFMRGEKKKEFLIKIFVCNSQVEGDTCCLYKQPEGMKVEKWAIRTANVTWGIKNYLNKIHTKIIEGGGNLKKLFWILKDLNVFFY